jgi:hypothetical protein
VASVGQCEPVGEDEGGACRLIGSPRTPHQNVQFLFGCLRLLILRLTGGNSPSRECGRSHLRRLFKKVSASCQTTPPEFAGLYRSRALIANGLL